MDKLKLMINNMEEGWNKEEIAINGEELEILTAY